jgi:hypothetical protein
MLSILVIGSVVSARGSLAPGQESKPASAPVATRSREDRVMAKEIARAATTQPLTLPTEP